VVDESNRSLATTNI